MQVITEGHKYFLENFEQVEEQDVSGQVLQFIHKKSQQEPNPEGILVTVDNGTTNEEVLEMLINRMNYLQSKFPCRENALVITKLEESLMWLNKRTEDRKKRNVEGKQLK